MDSCKFCEWLHDGCGGKRMRTKGGKLSYSDAECVYSS
jgi:hypothetical protein